MAPAKKRRTTTSGKVTKAAKPTTRKSASTAAKQATKTRTPSPRAVVERFFELSNALDVEGSLALIAERCVYENVPFHKAEGKARIRRDLTAMTKTVKEFRIETINIAVNDDVVLTERIDTLAGPGFRVALPVMGTFVVRDGKIVAWRDYLDWSYLLGHIVRGVVTSPARLIAERFS